MGDHTISKIDHANHLLLDQPLLRLPYELLRKNFRSAHFTVEHGSSAVKNLLKTTATGALNGRSSPDDVVKNLDTMIARMRGIKRKLAACADEEARLYRQVGARATHLGDLARMHTLDDVAYEGWSRRRLDRLLVDYLLRHGYNDSAKALAKERDMNDLVDIETFVAMSKIRNSLKAGSVKEALDWCTDNKKELRKMDSNLEFQLRFQQYIELVRTQQQSKMLEAIIFAKKFLVPFKESFPREVSQAGALLAFPPDHAGREYRDMYSPERWGMLADIFTETHNALLALPSFPLLHIALSSGLSALKTPACHSSHPSSSATPSHSTSLTTSVCPICSTELNQLARNVPYAHHSKSHVEHDLMLLPNGRVYGKEKLEEYAKKAALPDGQVKDLRTGEVYSTDKMKKVFIT